MRIQFHVLAYNLGNFLRAQVTPPLFMRVKTIHSCSVSDSSQKQFPLQTLHERKE
jgi:hypothetical protein